MEGACSTISAHQTPSSATTRTATTPQVVRAAERLAAVQRMGQGWGSVRLDNGPGPPSYPPEPHSASSTSVRPDRLRATRPTCASLDKDLTSLQAHRPFLRTVKKTDEEVARDAQTGRTVPGFCVRPVRALRSPAKYTDHPDTGRLPRVGLRHERVSAAQQVRVATALACSTPARRDTGRVLEDRAPWG